MIELRHIHKSFSGKKVLNNVSINIAKGEVVVIIGPSGSGKSTLLRCLNLLEVPDSGEIMIGGVSLNTASYTQKEVFNLRAQTGMVFQNYNLFKNKTALENITEGLIVVKKMSKSAANEVGKTLLAKVGMLEQASQYPITLSGGQQQRVAIARALAINPKAILFDEPTSALDPEKVYEVLHVIKELAKLKTTMVIVTHEMEFAKEVADRVIFMADGQVVEEGLPEHVICHSDNPITRKFLRQLTDKPIEQESFSI
ncbi:amino acid ABC transporter ATP-binding protein [Thorsellia anophelis]|uniref:Amino acid ABC transporter ATP-binding protein, PAAT family (TC 3.A.1.3.-) n=1 Tax=Thorsellia anophelis DSM 18579 TaxID=1123402 RepID=A0A1I0DZQ4_9GAMM|nr:amino acid ABC transporter ATP-binding protein [Thorsellia anophelis]SET38089.1 amino acid ABC transporter ATP-binding protein, PAAT family (TC 3.A.1.3.-) [Thorsellia anophelis DSM 18579]